MAGLKERVNDALERDGVLRLAEVALSDLFIESTIFIPPWGDLVIEGGGHIIDCQNPPGSPIFIVSGSLKIQGTRFDARESGFRLGTVLGSRGIDMTGNIIEGGSLYIEDYTGDKTWLD